MPAECTRRRLLAAAGGAGLACLAGCSALSFSGSDRQTFTLDRLLLNNHDDTAHTVHVYVTYDDDPVYWQSHALAPLNADGQSTVVLTEPWPEEPGRYTVWARVDDRDEWHTYRRVNNTTCAGLDVAIAPDGTVAAMSAADDTCDWG